MGGDRRLVSSGQALSVLVRQGQISHRKVTLPDPRKAGPLSQASHHEDTELKLGLVRERVGSDPERGHFLLNGCTSQRPPEKQNQQAGYAPGETRKRRCATGAHRPRGRADPRPAGRRPESSTATGSRPEGRSTRELPSPPQGRRPSCPICCSFSALGGLDDARHTGEHGPSSLRLLTRRLTWSRSYPHDAARGSHVTPRRTRHNEVTELRDLTSQVSSRRHPSLPALSQTAVLPPAPQRPL